MLGKTSVSDLSEHVFDLILELYNIDSHLLLSVLPQLEFKLKVDTHTLCLSVSLCVGVGGLSWTYCSQLPSRNGRPPSS